MKRAEIAIFRSAVSNTNSVVFFTSLLPGNPGGIRRFGCILCSANHERQIGDEEIGISALIEQTYFEFSILVEYNLITEKSPTFRLCISNALGFGMNCR